MRTTTNRPAASRISAVMLTVLGFGVVSGAGLAGCSRDDEVPRPNPSFSADTLICGSIRAGRIAGWLGVEVTQLETEVYSSNGYGILCSIEGGRDTAKFGSLQLSTTLQEPEPSPYNVATMKRRLAAPTTLPADLGEGAYNGNGSWVLVKCRGESMLGQVVASRRERQSRPGDAEFVLEMTRWLTDKIEALHFCRTGG